jgi:uncharacterized cupredoxin-like copper-binding protein
MKLRGFYAAVATACALAVGVGVADAARMHRTATTTVKVTAKEFKFVLSKRSVHRGRVVFVVHNAGRLAHDFKIAGRKTKLIKPRKTVRLVVTFRKKGRYTYLCTVRGHAAAGMKGRLVVR